jgi:hypothetical protein
MMGKQMRLIVRVSLITFINTEKEILELTQEELKEIAADALSKSRFWTDTALSGTIMEVESATRVGP